MAAKLQVATIRERVARDVQAAADGLRRLAMSEEVDQVAQLHALIQRLAERLDDAILDLELAEGRQPPVE